MMPLRVSFLCALKIVTLAILSVTVAGDAVGSTSVIAWGGNGSGQTNVPPNLTNAVSIAAGSCASHTLALRADGTVVAWGKNSSGQTNVPTSLSNGVAVAVGLNHSLALKADGTVAAWGDNTYGQLDVPLNLSNAVAIAAGGYHTLAIKADKTVVAWGASSSGQTAIPANLTNVVAVAGGNLFSLALKADGNVVAWGVNSSGQTNVPANLTNAVAIAAGWIHSLALKADGTVVAWGENSSGQTTIPTGLTNVVAIAAGGFHSLAIKADKTVVAWGAEASDQLVIPTGLTNVTAIAGGQSHSLALAGPPLEFQVTSAHVGPGCCWDFTFWWINGSAPNTMTQLVCGAGAKGQFVFSSNPGIQLDTQNSTDTRLVWWVPPGSLAGSTVRICFDYVGPGGLRVDFASYGQEFFESGGRFGGYGDSEFIGSGGECACVPAPANIVLWLPFDEASGPKAHNAVGGGNYDGTHYNGNTAGSGPTVVKGGTGLSRNNWLRFDGVANHVRVPYYYSLNPYFNRGAMTLDAWVKRDPTINATAYILDKRREVNGNLRGWSWAVNSLGQMEFVISASVDGTVIFIDNLGVVPANEWAHVAVSFINQSGTGLQFYLNGEPTASFHTLDTSIAYSTGPLLVGMDLTKSQPWKGCLDEIEIFGRVLAANEVKTLYDAGLGGKCKCFCVAQPTVTTFRTPDLPGPRRISARIFNLQDEDPTSFNYAYSGWLPPGTVTGTAVINPVSGSLEVPAFSSKSSSASTITRPAGVSGPSDVGYFEFVFAWDDLGNPLTASSRFACRGEVRAAPTSLAVQAATPVLSCSFKKKKKGGMSITNPTPALITFDYQFVVKDVQNRRDFSTLSLNDQVPGTPVTGTVSLPAGGWTNLELTVAFTVDAPMDIYTIQLLGDFGGGLVPIGEFQAENALLPFGSSLSLTRSASGPIISWDDPDGILQQANQVTGTWADVPGATNGYPVNSTGPGQFFRLRLGL